MSKWHTLSSVYWSYPPWELKSYIRNMPVKSLCRGGILRSILVTWIASDWNMNSGSERIDRSETSFVVPIHAPCRFFRFFALKDEWFYETKFSHLSYPFTDRLSFSLIDYQTGGIVACAQTRLASDAEELLDGISVCAQARLSRFHGLRVWPFLCSGFGCHSKFPFCRVFDVAESM